MKTARITLASESKVESMANSSRVEVEVILGKVMLKIDPGQGVAEINSGWLMVEVILAQAMAKKDPG